jgi:hypothetical protein
MEARMRSPERTLPGVRPPMVLAAQLLAVSGN